MLQTFPLSGVALQYASWSFVAHRYFCVKLPVQNAFNFATDYLLPPAVRETREARKVIFVLGNSNDMQINYQKVSLLKRKH